MQKQETLKDMLPDMAVEKRIAFLLFKLSEEYGAPIRFNTFYPQFESINEIPQDLRGAYERGLIREVEAINRLGERALTTLATREKLAVYFAAVARLIDKMPEDELNRPRTWADVRNIIGREVESGKRPDDEYKITKY